MLDSQERGSTFLRPQYPSTGSSEHTHFFSRINILCWHLFRYPFHLCVTAVARKISRSSSQKCRWQVTYKHACTLVPTYVALHDGSSFTWHQPCHCCKYTTLVESQNRTLKTVSYSCERSESARERRIVLYKSDKQQHTVSVSWFGLAVRR